MFLPHASFILSCRGATDQIIKLQQLTKSPPYTCIFSLLVSIK